MSDRDPATDPDAPARREAREHVAADTSLTRAERELTLRSAVDRDVFDVFTAERGTMRRVLAHPEATIQFVNISTTDVGGEAVPLGEYDGEHDVVGVKATLPRGTVTVRREPRKHGAKADVVARSVLSDGGQRDASHAGGGSGGGDA